MPEEMTPAEEICDALRKWKDVVSAQQCGNYVSVVTRSGPDWLNDGGVLEKTGWAIVGVDWKQRRVVLAPVTDFGFEKTGEVKRERRTVLGET